ncbi:hypothetical protein RVW07_004432 [Citrobacter freundii]|uniref:hypothetical protein n=1 Tax=Citrobacter freundii TaxID=546 RepID=UPI001902B0E3|nr:hypothetical protein [Citrobacter freundii]ELK6073497.1 hypothetical protein [Citrobacter freundii]ELK6560217.1 hypothetical protein [Citrobacter freundii]ELT0526139.1 hypothetical protein [Citrobacter freundii]MBJ8770946.1 hypothetical protein [Citrobacter freundii]HAT3426363.1 hypothetical protein [Citrobacter freundii]
MKPTYGGLAAQLAKAESKYRELVAENGHARRRHIFIRALEVLILEHSGGRMNWRGAMEDAGHYPAHQLPLFARDHSPGMLANSKSKCQENKSRPTLNPFRHYEHRYSYAC